MKYRLFPNKKFRHLLSGPIIYSVFIPMVLLDLWVEMYHRIAFWLYDIPYVQRSKYIKIFDRTKLHYLQGIDKLDCAYCGYANGLFAYVGEIAGRTEQYWCGIKHEPDQQYISLPHQQDFLPYADQKRFNDAFPTKTSS